MKNSLGTTRSKYGVSFAMLAVLTLLAGAPFITPVSAQAAEVINTWWPSHNARMSGIQPFKAMVPGLDVARYEMFWQVDGGQWNWMDSNYADYPHKETSVDLTSWTWRGAGPYTVNFIARKNGKVIATNPVTIYVENGQPQAVQPAVQSVTIAALSAQTAASATVVPAPTPSASPAPSPVVTLAPSGTLSGTKLYVNQYSEAAKQAQAWQSSNPAWASMMQLLAVQPTAVWLGEWNSNVSQDVRTLVMNARASGSVATFVAYAIPQRDCGGYSSGGTNNPTAYTAWIDQIASGIGSDQAIVVLEPDALSQMTCLSSSDQSTRLSLLSQAVSTLKKNADTKVYIDAGHSGWIDAKSMADRLNRANLATADGFALNVSNFMPTASEIAYGEAISTQANGKHFVIDTSRNGNGSDGTWCNPTGRAIGARPTTSTGHALADAYLWLKVPGESDGPCNGGPSAGAWWGSYALGLVQNARIAGL